MNPIESQFLILSHLLKAISLQDFTGFLSIEKRIYSIILIFCVMKNLLLSTPYLTKLIPPKLFTTVFTLSILFPKKNGALPLILPEQCLLPPSPIPTMIISLLGQDLCFTRMKTCLIPSLLTLIKVSLVICLFVSTDGGPNLAVLMTYFLNHYLMLLNVSRNFIRLMLMVLNSLLCFTLLSAIKYLGY